MVVDILLIFMSVARQWLNSSRYVRDLFTLELDNTTEVGIKNIENGQMIYIVLNVTSTGESNGADVTWRSSDNIKWQDQTEPSSTYTENRALLIKLIKINNVIFGTYPNAEYHLS